jgi:hypothetical protein
VWWVPDDRRCLCKTTKQVGFHLYVHNFVGFAPGCLMLGHALYYVFSDKRGYLAYAGGIGVDLHGSAGAYMPRLRQLVLWVPDDRTSLWKTTKHEGFHQYLHNFVADAPRWFNEGHAEYYEISGYEGGFLRTGKINTYHVETLQEETAALTPLKSLLRMDGSEFWEGADLHYPQSWALVQFLRHPPKDTYKGLIDTYFALLREGKSGDAAYNTVFKKQIKQMEADYLDFIDSLER